MYSRKVLKFLEKNKIRLNDKAKIITLDDEIEGILLNRPDYLEDDTLIIKLSNGYNIGINLRNIKSIKVISKTKPVKTINSKDKIPKKPFISILHTGGTIASKVDYRTGGVVSRFSPDELIKMFPDLKNYGGIHSVFLGNMFSDDMRFSHYKKMAEAVKAEISKGSKGVIITHGTDTLGYTSAALSFMLENVPIPV
ncbi:Glu-tRNA(Gln) amidotransferase GatDE subunit D, partial [archaeon CG07_land_8_20_14_0_80_38_8]